MVHDGRLTLSVSDLSWNLAQERMDEGARPVMRPRAKSPAPKSSKASLLAFAAVAVTLASLAAVPVSGGERRDHDKAREALERGEIKPLEEILALVRDQLKGRIVGVEIEREKGRWMYEFRLVDDRGRVSEAYVDGLSGKVDKIERK